MKEEMNVDKNKNVTAVFRVVILLMGICLVSLSVLNLIKLLSFEDESVRHINEELNQWKVRSLLPEILIRSFFPTSLQTEAQLTELRNQFLTTITDTIML